MTATNGGTCDTCGELNVAGTQFCTSCGSYLGWNAPVVPSADDGAPAVPRPRRPPPPPGAAEVTRPMGRVVPAPPPRTSTRTMPPRAEVAAAPPSSDTTCPSCRTLNAPTRRFCGRCGYVLQSPVARPRVAAARPPWWRRWFHRRPTTERAARAAFRQTLSWRSRIFRGLCLLVAVVAALGLLRFVGRDPLGWARHRIDDLRNTLVEVKGVTATVDPPKAVDPAGLPAFAVDGRIDTAWHAGWNDPGGGATTGGECPVSPAGGTDGALLLTAPGEVAVRSIRVRAGLPVADANRPLQWRPRVLELRFSGGTCQRVPLLDSSGAQIIALTTPVTTNAVRVSVVGAFAPAAPPKTGSVAITEIDLLARPR